MNGLDWLLDVAKDLSAATFPLALHAASCAALLAVVVLVVDLALRRWLSAAQLGLLWGLVLLRLCLPVVPTSTLSLEHFFVDWQS